jgi:hypothetical protein
MKQENQNEIPKIYSRKRKTETIKPEGANGK